jgi:tetratricopeptide (TPR) repeat protein
MRRGLTAVAIVLLMMLSMPGVAVAGGQTPRAAALDRAATALAAGRRAEAAALYQAAADEYQSVQALLQLARIQSGDGNAPGALKTLTRARSLAPNSEDVLSAFAQVSLAARLVVPAILALHPLARICPDVADYHYLLGVALMQAGDMIAAGDSLQQAERLDPNRPLTLIALGLVLNNRKMFVDAKTYLSRALERDPESVEANAALAETEDGLGETAAAEARARRVLDRAPNNGTALLVLGMTLLEQERFADARGALEKAAVADPVSPKPDYQLSLVYTRLGDEANAQKHLGLYRQKLRDMDAGLEQIRKRTGLPAEGGMAR